MNRLRRLTLLLVLGNAAAAWAGPWTRDAGHFYLSTSYLRIAATSFYGPDFSVVPIRPYEQQLVDFYGEVGAVTRWLTFTVDGVAYRRNELVGQGFTQGVGDWRVGVWNGLLVRPFRLAIATTVGIPFGDAHPSAGAGATVAQQQIANSLPTGDGEWNIEWRLSAGYSFGKYRHYPLQHYVIGEVGFWLRTGGIADSFVYRFEIGTQVAYKYVDHLTLILRLNGVESFASDAQAAGTQTGLGNGVTFVAIGAELYGRIWRGLGASIAWDDALRARSLPAAGQLKVSLSYQY
jgi:hypothetical protein